MSGDLGNKVYPLSRDHKPSDNYESKRIVEAGGKIYQTQTTNIKTSNVKDIIMGPLRVLPGRLSVSRTFGDAEAKLPKYNGNQNVVIAVPEIKSFKISKDHDFIIICSDGVFDKLSNREIIQITWDIIASSRGITSTHQQCVMCVDNILKTSLMRRTLDNVTCVMLSFFNLQKRISGPINLNDNKNELNKCGTTPGTEGKES